jgi:hypothetical protein
LASGTSPKPEGQPGHLRLDTVHQGDGPEDKGVYQIDAVDEAMQWQVVGATPRISASFRPSMPGSEPAREQVFI